MRSSIDAVEIKNRAKGYRCSSEAAANKPMFANCYAVGGGGVGLAFGFDAVILRK